jgi:hypothetical protein
MDDFISPAITSYDNKLNKLKEIYDIFVDYFGKDRVDVQGIPKKEDFIKYPSSIATSFDNAFILVYFPEVTVTNEHDKSITIYGVYVKIKFDSDVNIISFGINRSDYTYNQFTSRYVHSHVPRLNYSSLSYFHRPCYGTGPIRDTLLNMAREYDKDIYKLFCRELDLYLHVESLSGGPYMRLEDVNDLASHIIYHEFSLVIKRDKNAWDAGKMDEFIPWLLKKRLFKFNYINNSYSIAMDLLDYMLTVSNAFIEFYNTYPIYDSHPKRDVNYLYNKSVIRKYIIKGRNNIIERGTGSTDSDIESHEGEVLFTFRGKDVKFHVRDNTEEDTHEVVLLEYQLAMFILNRILITLNYCYGRNTASQKIYYL